MKRLPNKLILLICLVLILLTGCKKTEDVITKEEEVVETPSVEENNKIDSEEIMEEFYSMINAKEDSKLITKYVYENVNDLEFEDADSMILDYENYLTGDLNLLLDEYVVANSNVELIVLYDTGITEANISKIKDEKLKELVNKTLDKGFILNKGENYIYPLINYSKMEEEINSVSGEIQSYIRLMAEETSNPFTFGDGLEIPLEELLARSLATEKHIVEYNEGKTFKTLYDIYINYLETSILGTGNPYVFTGEGTSIISEDILNIYEEFVKNNNSRTSNILKEYINLLEENNQDIDSEEINNYYTDLYRRIEQHLNDI